MLNSFWNNLLYKNWLVGQMLELDRDVILLLKRETHKISKIRSFIPPALETVENLIGCYVNHNNIIFKVHFMSSHIETEHNIFGINYDYKRIYYIYRDNFNPDYMNSYYRNITLEIILEESDISFNDFSINNSGEQCLDIQYNYVEYPNATCITFF